MGALFIKSNPQLAYPPKTEAAIWEWVEEKGLPLFKKKTARKVQQYIDKDQPVPVPFDKFPVGPERQIAIDLSGVPDHYPKDRMLTIMPSVKVRLEELPPVQGGVGAGATWTYAPFKKRGVTLFVPEDVIMGRQSIGSYVTWARSALQHELRHMMQSLLADAMGIDPYEWEEHWAAPVGVPRDPVGSLPPSERLRRAMNEVKKKLESLSPYAEGYGKVKNRLVYLQTKGKYYLEPKEFYPHLGDRKDELDGNYGAALIPDAALDAYLRGEGYSGHAFVAINREFAPERFKVLAGELKAWQQRRNEALRSKLDVAQGKKPRPTTTSRLVSFVQDDLDREDAVLARYLRKDREKYMTFANNMAQYGEEPL